jgi:hypothetical protein
VPLDAEHHQPDPSPRDERIEALVDALLAEPLVRRATLSAITVVAALLDRPETVLSDPVGRAATEAAVASIVRAVLGIQDPDGDCA